MAVVQIPNMNPAISLTGNEELEAVQAGSTVRVTSAQIASLASIGNVSFPLPVGMGGTGGSVASGTLLDNITGFSSTGFIKRTGAGTYTFTAGLGSGSVILSAGGLNVTSGKTLAATQSITLAGTDSTVMTFPTTSATLARTDAGQTFIGTNNFGVITATTLNGLTLTTSTGTFTLTAAKTLSVTNTLTLSGTDSTTMTFPSTSATLARTDAGQTFTGTNAFAAITATTVNKVTITTPASGSTLTVANGKTLTASASITLSGTDGTALSLAGNLITTGAFNTTFAQAATTTVTLPATSATMARTDAAQTFAGDQTFSNNLLLATGSLLVWNSDVTFSRNSSGLLQIGTGTTANASGSLLLTNLTTAGKIGAGTATSSSTWVNLAAGTTGSSQIRFVQGSAPSAPVDGDMWREDNTNTGLKIRINGITKTITVA